MSTFTANGTSSTGIDTSLRGGDNDYIGSWIVLADGNVVSVTAFDEEGGSPDGKLTFTPTQSDATQVESGDEYEMWPDELPPAYIDSLIGQAITDATGIAWDSEEDITVHLHPDEIRYDIPTQFSMINKIELRGRVSEFILEDCESVWGTIGSNVTGSADTEIKRRGNASLKLVVASASNGDDLATETISSSGEDLSQYTHIEGWIRSVTALAAGDVSILLSDSGGVEETLAMPATTAGVQKYFRVAFAAPQDNTTITTIVVDYTANATPNTLWFDDIKTTINDRWKWSRVNMRDWYIDQSARDIMFRSLPPYALMKISGGDKPALPTSDTNVMEIDDQYVINWATAWEKMRTALDGPERNLWSFKLDQSRVGIRKWTNVRKISG